MGCVCDASSCLQKSLLSQSVGCIQRWSGVTQSPVTVKTSVCPRALYNTRGPHSACSLRELLPRDLRRWTWDWARAKSCLDPTLLFHQWKHQSSPLRLVDRNCAQPARQSVFFFWGGELLEQLNTYLVVNLELTLVWAPAFKTTGKGPTGYTSFIPNCIIFYFG